MTERQSMGLIGLGVMGRNLALNMMDKGFAVAAFDPWPEARARFKDEAPGARIAATPEELVAALPTPRTILIMVKAGEPVDAMIDAMRPLLDPGDSLIDGGNSHYRDTMARDSRLKAQGLHFLGLGISGGEEGARHGPSLMAGGDAAAFERARPILEAIAARFEDTPCCARIGADGSGHFVKMIHNGIEYGIMQVIAEVYVLLRDLGGLDHGAMADVFEAWNEGPLSSYLMEITGQILRKPDDLGAGPLVERILDSAGQKGTGRWSSEAALELGMPTPTITEAVFARTLAALRTQRLGAAKILHGPDTMPNLPERDALVDSLGHALLGGIVATYAQGLAVITEASREQGWAIDLARVAAIWRAGCVIRARLLDDVMRAQATGTAPDNLMCAPAFAEMLESAQAGWRQAVVLAVQGGIPVPGLSSALAYYDGYRAPRLWANMIQAQRDCFGAHGYERLDRPGSFHTKWR